MFSASSDRAMAAALFHSRHRCPPDSNNDHHCMKPRNILLAAICGLFSVTTNWAADAPAASGAKKPNILVLWGDDIGQFNISAYNMGMMGYRTPNIDRLAKEGALFT